LACGVEYLEIAKAGCCSIKAALLAADGIRVGGGGMHEHPHWREIPADWKPKLTFTVVRHPLDRLRSAYYEKLQRGLAKNLKGNCPLPKEASFSQWVQWVTKQDPAVVDRHWAPQAVVLDRYKSRDKREPQWVGRFEHLGAYWRWLQELHGLPDLLHYNKSTKAKEATYSHGLVDQAARFYMPDLRRFGYHEDDFRPPTDPGAWIDCPGFLFRKEAEELQRLAAGRDVLECGVWKAKSSLAMAATAKHVVSVDNFQGDAYTGRASTLPGAWRSLTEYHGRHKVTLMAGDFRDVLPRLDLSQFGLFFYDADHSYEATAAALRLAEKRMRRDLTIAVHDYKPHQKQILRAVDQYLDRQAGRRRLRVVKGLAILEPAK